MLFRGHPVGAVADSFCKLSPLLLSQGLECSGHRLFSPQAQKSVTGVAAFTIASAPLFWHILCVQTPHRPKFHFRVKATVPTWERRPWPRVGVTESRAIERRRKCSRN